MPEPTWIWPCSTHDQGGRRPTIDAMKWTEEKVARKFEKPSSRPRRRSTPPSWRKSGSVSSTPELQRAGRLRPALTPEAEKRWRRPSASRRRAADGGTFLSLRPSNLAVPDVPGCMVDTRHPAVAVLIVFSFLQAKYYRGRLRSDARDLGIADRFRPLDCGADAAGRHHDDGDRAAVGFPFALWLAKGGSKSKPAKLLITLLTIPFFLDLSSRTIVWRSILGTTASSTPCSGRSEIIDQPITWLLYSEFSVISACSGRYFPTMVFPIFMIISLIDDRSHPGKQRSRCDPGETLSTSSCRCRFPASWPA